jgi:hypothetical protein
MTSMARSWIVSAVALLAACSPSGSPRPAEAEPRPAPSSPPPIAETPAVADTSNADAGAFAAATSQDPKVPDIEYVPTPPNVVDKMLQVAKLSKDDVLYDLGCGDARIVIAAATKFGLKAKGFDIDPVRVEESRANVRKAKVEHLVTIEQKDIFEVDLSPATVVSLYLLPELNVRLVPQLEKLKPSSRVVSHDFDMAGVEPEKWWTVMAPDHRDARKTREHYVYLWKTPLKRTKG